VYSVVCTPLYGLLNSRATHRQPRGPRRARDRGAEGGARGRGRGSRAGVRGTAPTGSRGGRQTVSVSNRMRVINYQPSYPTGPPER